MFVHYSTKRLDFGVYAFDLIRNVGLDRRDKVLAEIREEDETHGAGDDSPNDCRREENKRDRLPSS